MMIPKTTLRKFRSYLHRRRLAERLPELEVELIAWVQRHGVRQLAGYSIEVVDGELHVRKLPEVSVRQLPLPLGERGAEPSEGGDSAKGGDRGGGSDL
jgi:hypothetical protein